MRVGESKGDMERKHMREREREGEAEREGEGEASSMARYTSGKVHTCIHVSVGS